jgi:glycerol-3-phosphate acyltransferase PlsX
MKIIIDLMGGDGGPEETLKGTVEAAKEFPGEYVLVGNREIVEEIAARNGIDLSAFTLVHADSVIQMDDDPLAVVRAKKDSSMSVALQMLAANEGDVLVSTGNTGALYTGATLIVRKIKGVKRAAISAILPMSSPLLLVDSGANIAVTPAYLEQFALMGSAYMKKTYGLEAPRVGLLNNGAEDCKGTQLQIDTYKLLMSNPSLNFVGNVEGNQLQKSVCDVLVTDGFTGNILLKTVEGMGKMMLDVMKGIFYESALTKMSALLVKKQLTMVKQLYDPAVHGGAPMLGISKPVIKAHGSSKAKAFKNAIRQAVQYYNSGVIYEISQALEQAKTEASAENGGAAE